MAILRGGTPFEGIYDGGAKADGTGYEIKNLKIDIQGRDAGLFGAAENATLRNIRIGSGSVIKGIFGVGGIVGLANSATIENCHNSATVIGTGRGMCVGGIVGGAGSTKIENCNNSATVTSTGDFAGGITGYAKLSTITNCDNSAAVTSTDDSVGGVIGELYDSNLRFSFNTGRVEGNHHVGGVVGLAGNASQETSTIAQVYNTGSVNGSGNHQSSLGGVIGSTNFLRNLRIFNVYNTGEVRSAGYGVGGVLGSTNYEPKMTLTNCFNTGNVTGTTEVGGAIGEHTYGGTPTHFLFKNTAVVTGIPDSDATAYNVEYTNISGFVNATGANRKYWDDKGRLLNPDGTLMAGPNPGGA